MLYFTKKEQIVILLLSSIIIVIIAFNIFSRDELVLLNEKDKDLNKEVLQIQKIEEKTNKAIMVHIFGEVNNPGIITLFEGDRVIDAINKAGGSKSTADLNRVNLARRISDEEKIYIPKIGEKIENKNIDVDDLYHNQDKININNANVKQLESLPGIGAVKAKAIIDYRKEKRFESIDELLKIKGIGVKTLQNIKDMVTVN